MPRRFLCALLAPALVASLAGPAAATPRDTTVLTVQDTNGDNLLEHGPGEDYVVIGAPRTSGPPGRARS